MCEGAAGGPGEESERDHDAGGCRVSDAPASCSLSSMEMGKGWGRGQVARNKEIWGNKP